ncbi:YfzA family protein [Paenibacillus profundus]|uniref:YfzA family protein n=1 Tax=Paenibacillus profundus TaxID=1173085 RepID=A0ABS8YNU0_9BACL|nr:YfzA family protein [Paenibacillus profundus]MCE5173488.1 YfzA family protein [Paenibacillus profundus]
MHTQKGRPSRIKGWMMTLGGLLVVQIFFIVCEMNSWSQFREFKPGTLMGEIVHSTLFTEWFTPYNIPEFNVFTAFFAVTLLPSALIDAIKDIFLRK